MDPEVQEPINLNKLPVGTSANDLLAATNYDQLTIEFVSISGFEIDEAVLNEFVQHLKGIINKPNGISFKKSSISDPMIAPYSTEDLITLEDQYRTLFNDGRELAVFVFVGNHEYTENNVLGVAYRNTSFAIMAERIRDLSGGIGQPSEELVLQTVLRHEMGHLLGLVNIGTTPQTDHEDADHVHHCDVQDCLMHYTVETGDVISNLLGENSPPSLDAQCLNDLKENGGK